MGVVSAQWRQAVLLLPMHGAGAEDMRAAANSGLHRLVNGCGLSYSGSGVLPVSDVDVVECVQRPYEVKTHTFTVPDVGAEGDAGGGACGWKSPSLGSMALWTAQPTNRIPGHTGYLITATLLTS